MSIVQEIIKDGGYTIVDKFIKPSKWTRPQIRIKPIAGVIHWTANIRFGADAMANRNFFNNRTGDYGSAHTCGDDKEIIGCLPYMPNNAEEGYHVGADVYFTNQLGNYPNAHTVGHEMCVNKDGDFRESYKHAVWVMAFWCSIYDWNPQKNIYRHYDITHKDCPLPFLDLIYDDKHLISKGWTDADIKWMRDNLHIDGIQGDKLWTKYKSDVEELLKYMTNGKLDKNKISQYEVKKIVMKTFSKYFKDVYKQWQAESIDSLYEKKITVGDGKGNFSPDTNITRAETAVLIDRTINYIMNELKK